MQQQQPPFPHITPPASTYSGGLFPHSSGTDPVEDALNWKIQWEHEIVRDSHGNVIRDRMVQKSSYEPPNQQSLLQRPFKGGRLRRPWLLLLPVLLPACCPLLLFGSLLLSVVLSLLASVLPYLVIVASIVALCVFFYRKRTRKSRGCRII